MFRHQLGPGANAGEDPLRQQLGLAVSYAPCSGHWVGYLVKVRKEVAGTGTICNGLHSLGPAPIAPSNTSMHSRPVLLCVPGTLGVPGEVINTFQGEACELPTLIKENIAMVNGGKDR